MTYANQSTGSGLFLKIEEEIKPMLHLSAQEFPIIEMKKYWES